MVTGASAAFRRSDTHAEAAGRSHGKLQSSHLHPISGGNAEQSADPIRNCALETTLSRQQWDSVSKADRTPMQEFIWNAACLSSIYPGRTPVLLDPPGAIGLFIRKGLIPSLYLAGAVELGEPGEVLYESEEAAARIADALLDQRLPVKLGHPPIGTAFADAFISRAKRKGMLLTAQSGGSPYIELDTSWTDVLARFSSKRRSDFRRMMRRAAKEGDVSFEFNAPAPEEVDELLDMAIAVEARGWKSRNKTAIAQNADQLGFFRQYARLAAADGSFRIDIMRIGNEIAAIQICAEHAEAYWLFKIGFDERFSRASPGQLLLLESIERAARRGLKRYEFLGKSAPWTKFWTETERPRARMNYYPYSILGLAALCSDAAQIGARRLRQLIAERIEALRKR